MALTKVIGQGLGSLGAGAAADAKIVFDGNAQDYHIGLDDSADTLVIGKGSALGTTTAMSFDANGIITKPLQPAFLAIPSSAQDNIAVNTAVTVVFGTEIFDQNADFSSNTFTAPVTGRYHLDAMARVQAIDSASSYYFFQITTSNRVYQHIVDPDYGQDNDYYTFNVNVLADMDANDTAYVIIQQGSGTGQSDLQTKTHFSGYLAC